MVSNDGLMVCIRIEWLDLMMFEWLDSIFMALIYIMMVYWWLYAAMGHEKSTMVKIQNKWGCNGDILG